MTHPHLKWSLIAQSFVLASATCAQNLDLDRLKALEQKFSQSLGLIEQLQKRIAELEQRQPATAVDLIVIANTSVQLTADEMRNVFVGDKQFAGNIKLIPIDNASMQADFLHKIIKVDGVKYLSIWAKKSFLEGMNLPPQRGSDAEIIQTVKHTVRAVGHVRKAPDGVRVIGQY